MNRREFSKVLGLTALAGGAATQVNDLRAAASRGSSLPEKIDRAHRMEWAREHFRGFENILVASFSKDLKELDEEGIRLDVRKSIEHGFFSTLCAPAALSNAEMKRFVEITVDEAAGKIAVGMALHAETEEQMFELMQHGEKVGVQHFLLELPREGSADDLVKYGMKYSEATNMGIYLWMAGVHNFKRFHPSAIPFDVFDRLAPEPNIVALKVGNMDAAVIFQLFERYNHNMLIGALLPNIMPMAIKAYGQQWSGAWTVEALQSPENPYAVEFFDLMMKGKYEQGMKLYWRHVIPGFGAMMKLMGRHMGSGAHPWEHFKYYQFATGGNGGRMRVDPQFPDLPPVSKEDMQFIKGVYKRIGVPTTSTPDEAFDVGRVNYKG